MAEVKRKATVKAAEPHNEETFVASVKRNLKKRGAYSEEFAETDLQKEILEVPGDTVYVWNKSGGEFHVPPMSNKPDTDETIIVFEVNQVLPFEKKSVTTHQFKKCLLNGKLKLVSEEDAQKIIAEGERKLKKAGSGGKQGGLAPSGLPNSFKSAVAYIMDCDDIDELEGFANEEEREAVLSVIEERIDELENGEFQD
jgi:hypothetical protein